jgi:hypothetical protein
MYFVEPVETKTFGTVYEVSDEAGTILGIFQTEPEAKMFKEDLENGTALGAETFDLSDD